MGVAALQQNRVTRGCRMEIGVFIPIGNNGWLISSTSPQYTPSFDLNREVVLRAERAASAASRVTGTTISNPSP